MRGSGRDRTDGPAGKTARRGGPEPSGGAPADDAAQRPRHAVVPRDHRDGVRRCRDGGEPGSPRGGCRWAGVQQHVVDHRPLRGGQLWLLGAGGASRGRRARSGGAERGAPRPDDGAGLQFPSGRRRGGVERLPATMAWRGGGRLQRCSLLLLHLRPGPARASDELHRGRHAAEQRQRAPAEHDKRPHVRPERGLQRAPDLSLKGRAAVGRGRPASGRGAGRDGGGAGDAPRRGRQRCADAVLPPGALAGAAAAAGTAGGPAERGPRQGAQDRPSPRPGWGRDGKRLRRLHRDRGAAGHDRHRGEHLCRHGGGFMLHAGLWH
ncbi:hypothetical protein FF3_01428 [Fretibacterium fastidiosum]